MNIYIQAEIYITVVPVQLVHIRQNWGHQVACLAHRVNILLREGQLLRIHA